MRRRAVANATCKGAGPEAAAEVDVEPRRSRAGQTLLAAAGVQSQ